MSVVRPDVWDPPPRDLGDIAIVLLAATLAGLRDRLFEDGYLCAAELVADVLDIVDDYIARFDP